MVSPINEIVIVGAEGLIQLRGTPLPPGSRAQVTVVPISQASTTPLQALDALQASLSLDRHRAEAWANAARDERLAFPRDL